MEKQFSCQTNTNYATKETDTKSTKDTTFTLMSQGIDFTFAQTFSKTNI